MPAATETEAPPIRKWSYKARRQGGEFSRGVVEARTHADAVRDLRRQGLAILEVELGDVAAVVGETIDGENRRKRLLNAFTRDDTVAFCAQVAVMLRTGVPLKEALETFADQASRPQVAEVVRLIRDDVCEGEDFSAALARWPRTFPPLVVSLIKAAEASGMLDEMMTRVAKDLAKQRKTSRQVKGAMTYPAIMLAVAVLAVGVIMTSVMPRFAPLFKMQGDALPTPTKVLLWLSEFIRTGWMLWVPGVVVAGFGVWAWMRSAMGRRTLDQGSLSWPVVGPLFRNMHVARFASTMATLMAAGVPLLRCSRSA